MEDLRLFYPFQLCSFLGFWRPETAGPTFLKNSDCLHRYLDLQPTILLRSLAQPCDHDDDFFHSPCLRRLIRLLLRATDRWPILSL